MAGTDVSATELIADGNAAVLAVAGAVLSGAPLVRCQLLASRFYEALKHELATSDYADPTYSERLTAAAVQCERAAARFSPATLLMELRTAVVMLDGGDPETVTPPPRGRPVLRVIQGGLL
jgi:hypothetical protein